MTQDPETPRQRLASQMMLGFAGGSALFFSVVALVRWLFA